MKLEMMLKKFFIKKEVSSEGYIRTDGLFNIEGAITDKKSYDIPKSDGTILKEGEPLHK